MSWARGSELFSRIAELIEAYVPNENSRIEIYSEMISAFEEFDCDTLDECVGIDSVLDELLKETYDSDLDDEEDENEDDWPDGGREDFS
jgi:hypothetical protein